MSDIRVIKSKEEAHRQEMLRAIRKAASNRAVMLGVLAAGGSAGGGVLLGAAVAGSIGAAAGGVIGAWAAYKAFRDAEAESRSPADMPEKTDTSVESH